MPKNDDPKDEKPLMNFMVHGDLNGTRKNLPKVQTAVGEFPRITRNPKVMGGKPCIRGMRVTVGMITGQLSAGTSVEELLEHFPYLEREDILEAIGYAGAAASTSEYDLAGTN